MKIEVEVGAETDLEASQKNGCMIIGDGAWIFECKYFGVLC